MRGGTRGFGDRLDGGWAGAHELLVREGNARKRVQQLARIAVERRDWQCNKLAEQVIDERQRYDRQHVGEDAIDCLNDLLRAALNRFDSLSNHSYESDRERERE